MKMNKKFISIILLMTIVFADVSMLNPQNFLANDNDYSAEYNQENVTDVYIEDAQQSIVAPMAASTYAASKSGSWIKASNGKWWYKHSDGTYTKNDWEYIDGYWYHFDGNGYMQTGWLKVGNYWYHLDYETGAMAIGWKKIYGEYYYFNSSGIRQVGWLKDGGYWYHLDYDTGIMAIGWKYVVNGWYYFNSSGIRQVGWLKDGGKWYHLDDNGIMQTGWQKLSDSKWYYFESDGVRHCGWLNLGGKTYYLNSDGIMQTGWLYLSFGSNYQYSGWFFFEYKDGSMRTDSHSTTTRSYYFYVSGEKRGMLKSTEMTIERLEQRGNHGCWAACAVMVGTYNTYSSVDQKQVIKKIKGSEFADFTASQFEERNAINFASGYTKSAYITKPLKFKEAVEEIDKNHPFTIRLLQFDNKTGKLDKDSGHSVVCSGYNIDTSSVRIIDPYPDGDISYHDYNKILQKEEFGDGRYAKCDMIITFNYK